MSLEIFKTYSVNCPDKSCGGSITMQYDDSEEERGDNILHWHGLCPRCSREVSLMSDMHPLQPMAQA